MALMGAMALALGCSSLAEPERQAASDRQKKEAALRPAAAFSLKDANGKSVRLADYRGKVVLLNFLATCCGPCKI